MTRKELSRAFNSTGRRRARKISAPGRLVAKINSRSRERRHSTRTSAPEKQGSVIAPFRAHPPSPLGAQDPIILETAMEPAKYAKDTKTDTSLPMSLIRRPLTAMGRLLSSQWRLGMNRFHELLHSPSG
jgi:hypothetical protein